MDPPAVPQSGCYIRSRFPPGVKQQAAHAIWIEWDESTEGALPSYATAGFLQRLPWLRQRLDDLPPATRVQACGLPWAAKALQARGVQHDALERALGAAAPPVAAAAWQAVHLGCAAVYTEFDQPIHPGSAATLAQQLSAVLHQLQIRWQCNPVSDRLPPGVDASFGQGVLDTLRALADAAAAPVEDEARLLQWRNLAASYPGEPGVWSVEPAVILEHVKTIKRAATLKGYAISGAELAVRLYRRLAFKQQAPLRFRHVHLPPGVATAAFVAEVLGAPADEACQQLAGRIAAGGGVFVFLAVPGLPLQPHLVLAPSASFAAGRGVFLWSSLLLWLAEAIAFYCGGLAKAAGEGAYALEAPLLWQQGDETAWVHGDRPVSTAVQQIQLFGDVVMHPSFYEWPGGFAHMLNTVLSPVVPSCLVYEELVLAISDASTPPARFSELTWYYGAGAADFVRPAAPADA